MSEAMAHAPVGDDQYREDPTINALEGLMAALLGKEHAMFVPSGTMANQIALRVLTRLGDEVIVGGEAHVLWHETGAAAANAGVQISPIGTSGLFTADDFAAAVKPRGHAIFPPTGLVVIENTHNRGGGVVFPQDDAVAICAMADAAGVATFLDGGRLFNAAIASGTTVTELARPFRMAWITLSKGLGCPRRQRRCWNGGRFRSRPPRATHVRRSAPAGEYFSCRGPLRARPQHRPYPRKSRQRARPCRSHRGRTGNRARSRNRTDEHRAHPLSARGAGRGNVRDASARTRLARIGFRRAHDTRRDTHKRRSSAERHCR